MAAVILRFCGSVKGIETMSFTPNLKSWVIQRRVSHIGGIITAFTPAYLPPSASSMQDCMMGQAKGTRYFFARENSVCAPHMPMGTRPAASASTSGV